jgi:DNA-binding phage protein
MVKTIKIKVYRTYKFNGQDPVIENFRTLMNKQKSNPTMISLRSDVSRTTIANWLDGSTKAPQFKTVQAATRALGFSYEPQKMKRK